MYKREARLPVDITLPMESEKADEVSTWVKIKMFNVNTPWAKWLPDYNVSIYLEVIGGEGGGRRANWDLNKLRE